MHSYEIHNDSTAPPASREILAGIKHNLGFIPNVFGVFANAPAALSAVANLNQAFEQSSFSAQEREIIALATSVENQCAYCVAGHTTFARHHDVDPGVIAAVREKRIAPDPRLEALRRFTTALVRGRGHMEHAAIAEFLEAGFSTDQTLDLLIGVAAKVMTNFASKLAEIPLDEAFVPQAWSADAAIRPLQARAAICLANTG